MNAPVPRTSDKGGAAQPAPTAPFFRSQRGFPEIGDEVTFQRSATHHPEQGLVRGRCFGTRSLEVIDMRGKPLTIDHTQYHTPRATHGRQTPPVPDLGTGGEVGE